jgi:hypothetical protein
MLCPPVYAGIEKPTEGSRAPHDGPNIASLRTIAEGTGIGEILRDRWSTVFLADDVVYLAAEEGVLFMQYTILAEILARFATS